VRLVLELNWHIHVPNLPNSREFSFTMVKKKSERNSFKFYWVGRVSVDAPTDSDLKKSTASSNNLYNREIYLVNEFRFLTKGNK